MENETATPEGDIAASPPRIDFFEDTYLQVELHTLRREGARIYPHALSPLID